jgi:ABC-type arginine/histidine transport system permease subunit
MYGSLLSVGLTYASFAKNKVSEYGLFGLVNFLTGTFTFAIVTILYVGYCEFDLIQGLQQKRLV